MILPPSIASLLAASSLNIAPLFAVFAVILVFSVLVSLVLVKARQSLLVGYFICGVVMANSGLIDQILVHKDSADVIHLMAEIGVILLMFTLGVEFPLKEIRYIWRITFLGGAMQMTLTTGIIFIIGLAFGFPLAPTFVVAVALALSSTAVSLKSFQDLGLSNHPGARLSLSIALFQDMLVILFILLLPSILGTNEQSILVAIGLSLGKGLLFMLLAGLLGAYLIPKLLDAVARTRSRELFTLTVIGLCATIAYAGSAMQLGLALGSFAAGLIVSGSIYSHRILSDILPFKDLLLTVFFVSVGLLIDLQVVIDNWLLVIAGVTALLIVKATVITLVAKSMKLPSIAAILSAASLASSGEFTIVLLTQAQAISPLPDEIGQIILVCTGISMGLVPTLMRLAPKLHIYLEKQGWCKKHQHPQGAFSRSNRMLELEDHAIIFGYGPVGEALNHALRQHNIPTLVIDLNAETIQQLYKDNQPALFADATHHEILELAKVKQARFLAYTFPHIEVTIQSLKMVRLYHPEAQIFARAKFGSEVRQLEKLGVQTIHDERESGQAMVNLGLSAYLVEESQ
ncbi:cation:proton antiporter [Verrucomicrobiaceae bacterium N1E253]|uniref:Cation:proton antiporter n=1 Tax=Oceaniferula marina TaxID=2748318 RepID=A0A851GCE9_9BACT|nr:cation:proton antiporter [Oceaniferula marina]NWK54612.1 cation:proton antiporter [Oceaniferula marina]